MSDKILPSIFKILENYKDPENNNSFDQQNPNIQVVEKNGNVNIIIYVTKQYLDKYEKLADVFKEGINKENVVNKAKTTGEPPLMLAMSVFYAIKDAIASIGNYQIAPELNAPATPERILMSVNKIKQKLKNLNGR